MSSETENSLEFCKLLKHNNADDNEAQFEITNLELCKGKEGLNKLATTENDGVCLSFLAF